MLVQFGCYQHRYEWKGLWCSSTVWLLSTQIILLTIMCRCKKKKHIEKHFYMLHAAYPQVPHELRHNQGRFGSTEADHDSLGLLQHEAQVARHTGQASNKVQCGADVLRPCAEGTPQVFNLLQMLITILKENTASL